MIYKENVFGVWITNECFNTFSADYRIDSISLTFNATLNEIRKIRCKSNSHVPRYGQAAILKEEFLQTYVFLIVYLNVSFNCIKQCNFFTKSRQYCKVYFSSMRMRELLFLFIILIILTRFNTVLKMFDFSMSGFLSLLYLAYIYSNSGLIE